MTARRTRPAAGGLALVQDAPPPDGSAAASAGEPPHAPPAGAAWLPVSAGRRASPAVRWALVDADLLPALAAYRYRGRCEQTGTRAGDETSAGRRGRGGHRIAQHTRGPLPARDWGLGVCWWTYHANGDRSSTRARDARRRNLRYATADSLNQAKPAPRRARRPDLRA
jgi:hypothetical protein